jgi:hypothetical protein
MEHRVLLDSSVVVAVVADVVRVALVEMPVLLLPLAETCKSFDL